ncbi:DUF421 domain-containing protein [Peribacillus kribbensis]|uniref:DUF421 domain-containing protein n=1 Tax=Peribacillus kribbensis TaxID=356658 RepID=UPI00041F6225|nr:DUF421 domain-containing protein [Peribacillus kribbensis]
MPGYLEIIIRTLTAFILLWIYIRYLGKQVISQKANHFYIASITMGTIAGNLAFNIRVKIIYFIISFVLMGTIVFVLNKLAAKYTNIRQWIAGKPYILIKNGVIDEEVLEKISYTMDSLMAGLRGKDVFNVHEVEVAVLEIDGSLSVLKKKEEPDTVRNRLGDANDARMQLPCEVLMEGRILHDNLTKEYGEQWLLDEISSKDLCISDIFYGVINSKGNLCLSLYSESHLK